MPYLRAPPSAPSRAYLLALLLAVPALGHAAEPAAPPAPAAAPAAPARRATDPYRVSAGLVLAGPVGNYGVHVGTQVIPQLELMAGVVMQSPAVTSSSGDVTAKASVGVTTPFLRARLWPFTNHNPIAEVGLALCHYGLSASASDSLGNAMTYDRSANLPIAFAGAGYGWRSDFGLRVTVLVGYMKFLSDTADPSTVTTTGSFNDADRAKLRSTLDDATDGLASSRPYLELGLGWMF